MQEFDKSKIVYLSPDSNEILEEVHQDHIYIIGGLVDRDVIPNITFNKSY